MSIKCTMILGDCLQEIPAMRPKDIVALVVADLPYGISGCSWDRPIRLPIIWHGIEKSCPYALILFFGVQPFVTDLINSNRKNFRYDIIWQKKRSTNFMNARHAPLRSHEHILVFGPGKTYNPQMTPGRRVCVTGTEYNGTFYGTRSITMNRRNSGHDGKTRFPKSVQMFEEPDLRTDRLNGHVPVRTHVSQKPLALLNWLVRTYSNPGDNVLDPVSGSFTTCVSACLNGRSSVGIEKDPDYFESGVERVRKTVKDNGLDVKLEVRR